MLKTTGKVDIILLEGIEIKLKEAVRGRLAGNERTANHRITKQIQSKYKGLSERTDFLEKTVEKVLNKN